nr:ATP-binding cassette domain-containing protein [Alphaproteobacteria bacterium]
GTVWLESYIRTYPHTVVIVSHDRDLLNSNVSHIVHLQSGKLSVYTGGYDDFETQRRQQQSLELKLKKKQDAERRRIQQFIDRFRAKATKATQAQSRIKALAKLQPIVEQIEDRVAAITFTNPEKMRSSPLLRLEDASVGYAPDQPILSNLDLRIDQDDRIALLGQNGNGKSTFAKLLSGKLSAQNGKVFGAKQITCGYFAQHQLDELNPDQTPYQIYTELLPEATEAQRRARLGTAGFGASKADVTCGKLSGGEKARLLLALAAFHGPHLLILDEPTNHLDIDSRQALIHGLAEFEGAVILISHDRHLIEASADRLWRVGDGTVRTFDGDLDTYRKELLATRGGKNAIKKKQHSANGDTAPKQDRAEQRRLAAQSRASLAPLKKSVVAHEQKMSELTSQIAKLDQLLADPELYVNDPNKAQSAGMKRGQLAQALVQIEEQWLAAVAELEAAEARQT